MDPEPGDAASPQPSAAERMLLAALPVLAVLYLSGLPARLGVTVWRQQFVAAVATAAVAAVFLKAASGRRSSKLAWAYRALVLISLATFGATAWLWPEIAGGATSAWLLAVGVVALVLVIEASRHTVGKVLFLLSLAAIVYALVTPWLPGQLRTVMPWDRLVNYLYADTSALFGSPVTVTATIVLAFILFGAVLIAIGGGDAFVDLALAIVGKRRGGPAKAAVVASSLFGSVSGSAVSNVVTTGSLTIPLMKRTGYPAHVAGGIEAVASTGGQLLPPIMGITAFLIADFLAMPYTTVALAAIAPALLIYLFLFIQVHIEGAKAETAAAELEDDDRVMNLRIALGRAWVLAVPMVVVTYALFAMNMPPGRAALTGSAAALLCGAVKQRRIPRAAWFYETLVDAGRKSADLIVITAVAGIIIGVLSITGVAFNFTGIILAIAGGNLFLVLVVTGLVALVLGMGMPTVGVYVLLAVTAAPAVVAAGVPPLAAHFFILYYGMLSMVTPPICMASFAAAPIAGADPMRTGFASLKYAIPMYFLPFAFVYSPDLLFIDGMSGAAVSTFLSASFGTVALAVAVSGYWRGRLGLPPRALLFAMGVVLVWPLSSTLGLTAATTINGLLGLALVASMFLLRRDAASSSVAADPEIPSAAVK